MLARCARWKALSFIVLVLALGVILGLAFPPSSEEYPQPWATVSGIVGWTYFAAWSVSFWPQVIINYSRKSVVGFSLDYTALNILGFACYTAYNLAMAYSPTVRTEYVAEYGRLPGVQSNDVFFAIHALLLTIVVGIQALMYDRGGQHVARLTRVMLAAGLLFIIVYGSLALVYDKRGGGASQAFTWLRFLLSLSYVKLAISVTKYIPQVLLNYRRRSTVGWSVENVLLDFTGGGLSVFQQVGDAMSVHDWTIVTGDPVKFGLGNVSILFDIIFMVQHFVLYKDGERESKEYDALVNTADA